MTDKSVEKNELKIWCNAPNCRCSGELRWLALEVAGVAVSIRFLLAPNWFWKLINCGRCKKTHLVVVCDLHTKGGLTLSQAFLAAYGVDGCFEDSGDIREAA